MKFSSIVMAGLAVTSQVISSEGALRRLAPEDAIVQAPPKIDPTAPKKIKAPGNAVPKSNKGNVADVPMYDWINGADEGAVVTPSGKPRSVASNGKVVDSPPGTIASDSGRIRINPPRKRSDPPRKAVKPQTPKATKPETTEVIPEEREEVVVEAEEAVEAEVVVEAEEAEEAVEAEEKALPVSTGKWYELDHGDYQNPHNVDFSDDSTFTITIKEGEGNARIHSADYYDQGRFTIKMKSASKMPGVVTAFYLASGKGRNSDEAIGDQDELDFEIKGNTPDVVQSNLFYAGEESVELHTIGDTSATENLYTFDWNDERVIFEINGEVVREEKIDRPLEPMQMAVSVWTTAYLWPGVIEWAGETDWANNDNEPIVAEFEVVEMPHTA